jgi:hypothetical protein
MKDVGSNYNCIKTSPFFAPPKIFIFFWKFYLQNSACRYTRKIPTKYLIAWKLLTEWWPTTSFWTIICYSHCKVEELSLSRNMPSLESYTLFCVTRVLIAQNWCNRCKDINIIYTRSLCVPVCCHWVAMHDDDMYTTCIQLVVSHDADVYMCTCCFTYYYHYGYSVHFDNVQCVHWTCRLPGLLDVIRYHCTLPTCCHHSCCCGWFTYNAV